MNETSDLNILIIESNYYEDIADNLREGAIARLKEVGADYEIISVPGALEIPIALSLAAEAQLIPDDADSGRYNGCVALGCVIRGETTHYDTVANESARSLMTVATSWHLPLGNGILTVENREQALVRSDKGKGNKGGGAVDACLSLIALKNGFDDLS
ncbi:MAG: 6,7-dimethyl-8-ribityllumazine synthase [Methyloligellaceae bacterium]